MIKSEFHKYVYFVLLCAFIATIISLIFISGALINLIKPLGFYILFFIFSLYFWFYIVLVELRTKAIYVEIYNDFFVVKRFMGLGTPGKIYLTQIEGFKKSIISSKVNNYEYLYLVQQGKKVIKLSAFYHSNYRELKRTIFKTNLKYLGEEHYSHLEELKEIFVA